MKVTPYVSYNGNCEEAVLFYRSVLGGEAEFMRYSDLPAERTFWGSAYGSLVDRYGVHWGVEYELPSPEGA